MSNSVTDISTLETLKSREDVRKIFMTGVAAADPYQAVKHCLYSGKGPLEHVIDTNNKDRKRIGGLQNISLIAFGKAACAMTRAARGAIPKGLITGKGIAVTNYENVVSVSHTEVIGAGHPIPDPAGLTAADKISQIAINAQQDDLVLVLISGGGSALIPCPVFPVSLADKILTTNLLLACGATIQQINCVRKHLSRLKGGGLARLAFPASVHALILSDVPGNDISTIASGPTVADNTTYQDAWNVLESKEILNRVPESVRLHLKQGLCGKIPETPKPNDPVFLKTGYTLIGSNALSVQAMFRAAADLDYHPCLYSDHLCGEARVEAEKLADYVQHLMSQGIDTPMALIAGGETTVTLKGTGRGGRNQEMALAFAIAAERIELPACWTFLSGGTDGIDGPTDAAGGIVDPHTITRMLTAGINPVEMLQNNDAYNALKRANDLLITGATGTNVADLQILLIHPNS